MEKSTVVTLLIVAGLGGLALWWFTRATPPTTAFQTPPPGPCSSTGEQAAGGTFAAIGNYYTQGKAGLKPKSTCMGITAALKSVAGKTSSFLADHTTTKSVILFGPNSVAAPIRAVSHPVDESKGIYNAAGSVVSKIGSWF